MYAYVSCQDKIRIVNGEQLVEMYKADVDKQIEDKKDKEEKDEVI